MAIIAKAELTLSHMIDVQGTYRYYLLQSSTASAPAKPTKYPPGSPWTDAEPTYTSGSTNSLYVVDCSVYSNGTFYYSPVSLSTAYEAAKEAYNKAVAAQNVANNAQNAVEAATDVIVGTQTTVTGSWTGVAKFSELKDGQSIMYWLPYAGSGNATLNLTLSDGSTTGAINCYYKGTTRLTTHFAAGSVVRLVYKKNVAISGSGSYTGWWADASYEGSNTYDRIRYQQAIKCGTTAIVKANIVVGSGGVYKHLKAGTAFDISYPILYASDAISASGTGTNNYVCIPFTVTTTQSITLTAHKPVYIKGTLSGTTFTPISTAPLTQTVPTSEDGYDYILLGQAYSTTAMYLLPEHPIFTYYNGGFKSFEQIAVEAADKATDAKNTADAKNTVFYQTSAPTSSGRKTNDIWFDTDDGNKMYYWSGSAWAVKQFGQNALSAESITTNHLVSGAVTAAKINVSSLSAVSANLGTVTAGVLQSENFAMSDYTTGANGSISGTVTEGLKIDLNNKAYYTPQITIKENFIDLRGYMTIGNRVDETGATNHNIGKFSLAVGAVYASGDFSFASGADAFAEGHASFATGSSHATAMCAHAEGVYTNATAQGAHSEGYATIASGLYAHSEGGANTASGNYSHVEGYGNVAASEYQHVQGKYCVSDDEETYAHIVGNGSISKRSNAHTLDWDGNAWYAGSVTAKGGTLTGELFFAAGTSQPNTKGIKWGAFNSKNPYIGYCTNSSDGTFMVGSLAGTTYTTGLAIGGSSGNLLWKGTRVATVSDLSGYSTTGHTHSGYAASGHDHDGTYAKLTSPNNMIHNGNEVTWAPAGYNNYIWLNYRTGSTTGQGTVTGYKFGNGNGGVSGVTVWAETFSGKLDGNATTATTCTGNAATATKATNDKNGRDISRFYCSMIPAGTVIGSNANLNTTTYMKVGNYYCASNATTATLTNCPTVTTASDGTKSGVAFMMQVYSPLSTEIDNETTKTWIYRLRKLTSYTGDEFIQYCYVDGTAGNWIYGGWQKVLRQPTYGTAIGNATTPVYISSTGVPTACSSFATSGHTHTAATTSADGFMSATDKTKLNATNDGYATCATAAATAAKEITISGNTNWTLAAGSKITVLFSNTNTAQSPTFNVNGTGAKNVYYGTSQITTDNLSYAGYKGRPMNFVYDGTQYRFIGWGYESGNTNTYIRVYRQTSGYDGEYPLLVGRTKATSIGTVGSNSTYASTYGVFREVSGGDATITANPAQGMITAATFKGELMGLAEAATVIRHGNGTGYVNLTHSDGAYYFKPGTATNVTTPAFKVSCGGTSYRWQTVYAVNALNTSSDLRFKTDISKDLDKYVDMMDHIEPITFIRTNSDEDKRHAGYGAQDVEKALQIVGLENDDFAGLSKDWDEEKQDYTYGLSYEEFIPILDAKERKDYAELDNRLRISEAENRYMRQVMNSVIDEMAKLKKEIEQLKLN